MSRHWMSAPVGAAIAIALMTFAVGVIAEEKSAATEPDTTRDAERAYEERLKSRASGDAANSLRARLDRSGRAVVQFEREAQDLLSGEPDTHKGTLTLELPDRVLLHFSTTGERLALRGDGGEWLQPELEQMLVLSPEHLGAARLWWGFLLGHEETVGEHKVSERHYRLMVSLDGEVVDSAAVWLDPAALPERLMFRDDNGVDVSYRFTRWRFSKPRGKDAFVLRAPKSYEVVRLP